MKLTEFSKPKTSFVGPTYHGTTPDAAKLILKVGLKPRMESASIYKVSFATINRGVALSYGKSKSTPEFGGKKFKHVALIVFKSNTPIKYDGVSIGDVIHYYEEVPPEAIDRVEIYKVSDIYKFIDIENKPNKVKPIKIIRL